MGQLSHDAMDCVRHIAPVARNTLTPYDYKARAPRAADTDHPMLHENHTRIIGFDDGESLSHFGSPMDLP